MFIHYNRLSFGGCSSIMRSFFVSLNMTLLTEILVRIVLLTMFVHADFQVSTGHVMQSEDLWRYRYPLKESVVPFSHLLVFIFFSSIAIILAFGSSQKYMNISERRQAILSFTLSLLLAGVVINYMKLWIGRPRPNYLARCYGESNYLNVKDASQPCSETADWVGDKSKSFPSGHSGTAFSAFVFHSLYLAGKFGTFNSKGAGSGRGWRLIIPIIPLMISLWVACTRFTDYHHHVEDIMVGSLIGTVVAYVSYRLYFPSLSSNLADCPSIWLELGYPKARPKVEFIMQPKYRPAPASVQEGVGVNLLDGGSENMADVIPFSPNTLSAKTLKGLYQSKGTVNVNVILSRRPTLTSSMENNPASSKASIAFFWDSETEGNLDQHDVNLVTEELSNALISFSSDLQQQER